MENEDGFLLLDPRKVKEVTVLPEREGAVRAQGQEIVGMNDREGILRDPRGEAGAVFREKRGVERFVAHGGNPGAVTQTRVARLVNPS
jgi:hypothetical protein